MNARKAVENETSINSERPRKLPFRTKVFYSMGTITEVLMGNIIGFLALQIYNVGLGMSVVLVGYALSIPRLWDAFTDPLFANISDNTHTRFGRRRPFILMGAFFGAIFCMLIWIPPRSFGDIGLFVYLLVLSILFFTSYTVFTIPFHAMGYELTSDYDERTRLMSYKTFFMQLGGTFFLPWAYKLCMIFGNGDEVKGVRVVGVIVGIAIIIFCLFPVLFCKERFAEANREKIKIIPAIKVTFKNKPYLVIIAGTVCSLLGACLVNPFAFYINLAHVLPGDKEAIATLTGFFGTIYGVSSLLAIPVMNYLCIHWGKRQTLQALLLFAALGYLISWFTFNPDMPCLQLIVAPITAPGLVGIWLVTGSLLADVCDLEELNTGLRREGMYSGVFSWVVKVSVAGVMAVTGYVVAWTGYSEEVIYQTEQTILRLRLGFMIVPTVFLVLSVFIFQLYSFSRERLSDVQLEIAENKRKRANNQKNEAIADPE